MWSASIPWVFVEHRRDVWIVADAEDAVKLRRSGVEAGDVVLDRSEARELVRVADPDAVHSILTF